MFRYIERFLDGISREAQMRRLQRPSFTQDGWETYVRAYEDAYTENLTPELLPMWEREVADMALKVQEGFSDNPRGATEEKWREFSNGVAVVIVHDTFGIRHDVDLWPQISEGLNSALPGIVNSDNPPMIRLPEHPRDFRRG